MGDDSRAAVSAPVRRRDLLGFDLGSLVADASSPASSSPFSGSTRHQRQSENAPVKQIAELDLHQVARAGIAVEMRTLESFINALFYPYCAASAGLG